MRVRYLSAACGLPLLLLFMTPSAMHAKDMYIASEDGLTLKTQPKAWPMTSAGVVKGGAKVQVLKTQGAWTQIKDLESGKTGWVSTSSLSKKPLSISAGGKAVSVSATSEEASLATKGFSPDAEKEHKRRNPTLTYKWVDYMEKFNTPDNKKEQFLKDGNITPRGAK